MTEGLFPPIAPIDWVHEAGKRAVAQLVWGDVPCILRGPSATPGKVEVELLLRAGGQHKHDGPCQLTLLDPARIRFDRTPTEGSP